MKILNFGFLMVAALLGANAFAENNVPTSNLQIRFWHAEPDCKPYSYDEANGCISTPFIEDACFRSAVEQAKNFSQDSATLKKVDDILATAGNFYGPGIRVIVEYNNGWTSDPTALPDGSGTMVNRVNEKVYIGIASDSLIANGNIDDHVLVPITGYDCGPSSILDSLDELKDKIKTEQLEAQKDAQEQVQVLKDKKEAQGDLNSFGQK
jgi:hypothetical protein